MARETRREAAAEKRRASLLELRAILGEIRRMWEYGHPTPQKDKEKERLRSMLRVVGGEKRFPKTTPITEFRMPMGVLTDEGVAMLDAAAAEIDAALDAEFSK